MSIPFLLDEKPTAVSIDSAGEQSGGKQKVSYGDAHSNSGEEWVTYQDGTHTKVHFFASRLKYSR